jgi:probable rRNA maturation factor
VTGRAALTVRVARVPGGRRRLARDLQRLAAWTAQRYARALEVSFVVLGDDEMAELHERYAGVPGPTDVLAFPLADDPVLLGEVLVCAETARREAAARGHSAYDELLLYAVHGVLHLVGHDDHEPADRRRMRGAERRALTALGAEPVYARPHRSPPRRPAP